MRLLELQTERDSEQGCALAGRPVPDANLRGWAALLPADASLLAEGLRQSGLAVLPGSLGSLALGSLGQLWSAARSLAVSLERDPARRVARELMNLAASAEAPKSGADWKLPRHQLQRGRTLIMGIINATPDSFSDGGAYDPVHHGLRLAEDGADILDVGGESTRPNAAPVSAAEERARTEQVVRELHVRTKLPISIDTSKAEVSQAALDAGAEIVNDVSGLARDERLAGVAARAGAAVCLMHMRGTPREMQSKAVYADVLGEIQAELREAIERAGAAGMPKERIAIDPGLGFAKTAAHNFLLLRRLRELTQLGHPLLVGASRKSFIGAATGRAPADRLIGSVAAAVTAALNGAAIVRVHDVGATREALAVADAIRTSNA